MNLLQSSFIFIYISSFGEKDCFIKIYIILHIRIHCLVCTIKYAFVLLVRLNTALFISLQGVVLTSESDSIQSISLVHRMEPSVSNFEK